MDSSAGETTDAAIRVQVPLSSQRRGSSSAFSRRGRGAGAGAGAAGAGGSLTGLPDAFPREAGGAPGAGAADGLEGGLAEETGGMRGCSAAVLVPFEGGSGRVGAAGLAACGSLRGASVLPGVGFRWKTPFNPVRPPPRATGRPAAD